MRTAFFRARAGEVKSLLEHPGSWPADFPSRGDGGGFSVRAVLAVARLLGDGGGLDGAAGLPVSVVVRVDDSSASVLVKVKRQEEE